MKAWFEFEKPEFAEMFFQMLERGFLGSGIEFFRSAEPCIINVDFHNQPIPEEKLAEVPIKDWDIVDRKPQFDPDKKPTTPRPARDRHGMHAVSKRLA